MPLKLPRLSSILSIVSENLKATREFSRFWESAMDTIEDNANTQTDIIANLESLVTQQQGILSGLVSFSQLNVNGEVVTTLVTTATDLGLGNVEDKSAADIIAEITGADVVAALGQGAAVPDAAGGATIDAEARTALNALLAILRTQGVIAP